MKKQYNRKTIRKSIILMFIASTCQNMENPSYNSLTVSKINQGLLFLIRFKLFQTDIHKILHYRRRLPPLLPDQKDLRHQIRFIKHLTSQPFAKRLHGVHVLVAAPREVDDDMPSCGKLAVASPSFTQRVAPLASSHRQNTSGTRFCA